MLSMAPIQADAKRFGGRSMGKSYKTAPAKKQQSYRKQDAQDTAPKNNFSSKTNSNNSKSSKKGMLGGMLGGLMMGGLIGSLLSGNGFDGLEDFQFMDILMIAGIAFILFKLFKMLVGTRLKPQQHANYASAGYAPTPSQEQKSTTARPQEFESRTTQTAWAATDTATAHTSVDQDVPMNFPADFNALFFKNQARDHFRQVQNAWNKKDLSAIQEYLAPALHQQMEQDLYSSDNTGKTEVMAVEAEIIRADYNAHTAQVSVHFTGECFDQALRISEQINDIWHLERDLTQPGTPWLIVGITAS